MGWIFWWMFFVGDSVACEFSQFEVAKKTLLSHPRMPEWGKISYIATLLSTLPTPHAFKAVSTQDRMSLAVMWEYGKHKCLHFFLSQSQSNVVLQAGRETFGFYWQCGHWCAWDLNRMSVSKRHKLSDTLLLACVHEGAKFSKDFITNVISFLVRIQRYTTHWLIIFTLILPWRGLSGDSDVMLLWPESDLKGNWIFSSDISSKQCEVEIWKPVIRKAIVQLHTCILRF